VYKVELSFFDFKPDNAYIVYTWDFYKCRWNKTKRRIKVFYNAWIDMCLWLCLSNFMWRNALIGYTQCV